MEPLAKSSVISSKTLPKLFLRVEYSLTELLLKPSFLKNIRVLLTATSMFSVSLPPRFPILPPSILSNSAFITSLGSLFSNILITIISSIAATSKTSVRISSSILSPPNAVPAVVRKLFSISTTALSPLSSILVKNAVIRKLIDRSRKDRTVSLSIDNLQEEYGDIITETFQLVDSQKHSELQEFIDPSVDERIFTEDEVEYYRTKFEKLSENVRQSFLREYYKVRNVFASGYRNLFDTIIESVPTTIQVRRGARPEIPSGPVTSEKSFEELAQAMLNVLNALV